MNIVMQLKKVCNHPDLFDSRTIESPFIMKKLRIVIVSHFLLNLKKINHQGFIFVDNELNNDYT